MAETTNPMTIRLYDPEGEYREFTQMIVPWGIFKIAVRISESLDPEKLTDKDIDALAGLVVTAFGNRFSIEDLNNGATIEEMMTVINMIVARAQSGIESNPLRPR